MLIDITKTELVMLISLKNPQTIEKTMKFINLELGTLNDNILQWDTHKLSKLPELELYNIYINL